MRTLTDNEIDNILDHPGINASWFFKEAFEDINVNKAHNKWRNRQGQKFFKEEYDKLEQVIKKFSETWI